MLLRGSMAPKKAAPKKRDFTGDLALSIDLLLRTSSKEPVKPGGAPKISPERLAEFLAMDTLRTRVPSSLSTQETVDLADLIRLRLSEDASDLRRALINGLQAALAPRGESDPEVGKEEWLARERPHQLEELDNALAAMPPIQSLQLNRMPVGGPEGDCDSLKTILSAVPPSGARLALGLRGCLAGGEEFTKACTMLRKLGASLRELDLRDNLLG